MHSRSLLALFFVFTGAYSTAGQHAARPLDYFVCDRQAVLIYRFTD